MRTDAVVPMPQQTTPETASLAAVLSRTLGRLVSLVEIPLVLLEAGLSVTGDANGVGVLCSTHTVDWEDAGVDTWRLVGYAEDGASTAASLEYRVNGVTLASVALPQGSAADFSGDWMRVPLADRQNIAKDRIGRLFVVGNGADAVTLTSVRVQARTVRRVV